MAQFRWPNRSSKSSLVRGLESKKTEKKKKNQFIAEEEKFIINGKQSIMQSEYVGLARCIVFFLSNMTEHYYSFYMWKK